MLPVTLYNFPKRQNSTAVPSSGGTPVEVVLKQETSYNNPSFIIQADAAPEANYLAFDGAYYFIDDIRSVRNNIWELVCSIDPLGTLRSDILNTSAYVEYATGGSMAIQDDRIVPASSLRIASASAAGGFSSHGCYLLSVVGKTGVATYAMDLTSVMYILNQIQNWADNLVQPLSSVEDVLKTVGTQIMSAGGAMECIRDCRWIPFPISDLPLGLPADDLSIGMYRIASRFAYVTDAITTKSVSLKIPFTRSGFLRLPPYSEVQLYLPFVGNIALQSPHFVNNDTLVIDISRNNKSGAIAYQIFLGGYTIGTYGAETAVSVPVGVSNISPQAVVTSAAGAAIAATYNPIGAVASAVSLQPTNSCVGGIQGGAGAGLQNDLQVTVLERDISGAVGNMDATRGLPVFANRRIGDISGYVQTRGVSIGGSGRGVLKEAANSLLDGGVFVE